MVQVLSKRSRPRTRSSSIQAYPPMGNRTPRRRSTALAAAEVSKAPTRRELNLASRTRVSTTNYTTTAASIISPSSSCPSTSNRTSARAPVLAQVAATRSRRRPSLPRIPRASRTIRSSSKSCRNSTSSWLQRWPSAAKVESPRLDQEQLVLERPPAALEAYTRISFRAPPQTSSPAMAQTLQVQVAVHQQAPHKMPSSRKLSTKTSRRSC